MGIEAFFEIARSALPGWDVTDVEDVEFLAPLKFYRNEPRTVRVEASVRREGDHAIADCQVIGTRQLAHQDEPQVTIHFTGSVRLARATSRFRSRTFPRCAMVRRPTPTRSTVSTSTGPHSGCWNACGVAGGSRRSARREPAARPSAGRAAHRGGAPADRAVFPDGGDLGAGHEGSLGVAASR